LPCDFRFGDRKIAKPLLVQIRKLRAIAKTEKHQDKNCLNQEKNNVKPSRNCNVGEVVNINVPIGPHAYSYEAKLLKNDKSKDQETNRYCE